MAFNFCDIRTGEEDDATFFPVLGDEPETVAPEPGDGDAVREFTVTAIKIQQRQDSAQPWTSIGTIRELRARAFLTDSRLAIVCQKFDKSSKFVGIGLGAVLATTANAVSKARMRKRSRGKHLVAQCRHPWMLLLGIEVKQGWLSDNKLIIRAVDNVSSEPRALSLELTLDKRDDAAEIAVDYARRVLRARLLTKLSDDDRGEVTAALDAAAPLQPAIRETKFYKLPAHRAIHESTAYPDTTLRDSGPV